VGDHFSVLEPRMSKESKAAPIDVLREILAEEGGETTQVQSRVPLGFNVRF
jgi:hypothetical protein